jgi:AcrR family transcriptional regulator
MFVMLYYAHHSIYKPRTGSMRYEKGQREATRQRIIDTASERFRSEGIAASGLAAIMSDAGLTNGAFYPHFESKAALIRESVAAAMGAVRAPPRPRGQGRRRGRDRGILVAAASRPSRQGLRAGGLAARARARTRERPRRLGKTLSG